MFAYRRQGPGRRQEAGGDGRVFGVARVYEVPAAKSRARASGQGNLRVNVISRLRQQAWRDKISGQSAHEKRDRCARSPETFTQVHTWASCHQRRLGESLAGRLLPSTHSSKSKARSSARSSSTSSLRLGGGIGGMRRRRDACGARVAGGAYSVAGTWAHVST